MRSARLSAALVILLDVAGGLDSCPSSPSTGTQETPRFFSGQSLVQLALGPREKLRPGLGASLLQTWGISSPPDSLAWLSEDSEVHASELGAKCAKDGDCGWHAYCADGGRCGVFPLFTMPWADGGFAVMSFFIAGISLAAGVGGGGLFVPMLMLLLSFDARTATGLSQSMLLGGATAAFIYNLGQSHPQVPSRPLVDFELACLLGPALMAGAQVGSLVHAVAPPAALLFLLCVVLFDSARKGMNSALKIRAKELEAAAAAAEAKLVETQAPSASTEPAQEPAPDGGNASGGSLDIANPEVLATSQRRVQSAKTKLLCVWLFTCVVILTKGLLVEICTLRWWGVVVASTVCLLTFAWHFANELRKRERVNDGSLDFRELAFPLVRWSLFAGALAALCGIGGGMVLGPILVGLKVPPPVSSATTATTLLLISSSTALVYWCRSVVPQSYSLFLSSVTACGALTGKVIIGAWVRRTGRDSVIVWCLAGITVLSTLLMGALGLYRVVLLGRSAFAFSSLCLQDAHLQGPTSGMKTHGG